ncbi:uncharacterized protein LOC134239476 [Saccostrea cucullata]|uniref:uncharacterized protein LOC134239476 n=1 Tax=Saccostrea cuccullata TaxID=36930 RepID=UPI002ED48AEE
MRTLCCYLCLLFLAIPQEWLAVKGYNLMTHLAHQADALEYGLKLAGKYNYGYGYRGGARVAFSAYTSSSTSYSSGSTVKFGNVVTNQGSAFKSYYYFQAPHAGLYAFSWTIRPYSSNYAYTSVRVNGSSKVRSKCYTGTTSYTDSCSNFAILSLKTSDKVSIYSDSTSYIQSSYSSFSGWEL